ncbi:hypothetical protein M0H57_003267 [Proteus mirabilis]|uniref:hypothetical protein n=1 Tax=Proteus mirabilis TaxID=584 RepID=UPI0023F9A097|nr:hypothetical protein [Proteus mirabilis]EKX5060556.1 hypothetical protein [Proteus mirabilis]MDF7207367.1 hypothetical protein [Proteus mirabilis]
MDNLYILLVVVILVLLGIFWRLGSILQQLENSQSTNNNYNNDHYYQRAELLKKEVEILEKIDDLSYHLKEIASKVEEIEHVASVFGKYKLQNKKEQKELDEFAINEEVFDGIRNAGQKT